MWRLGLEICGFSAWGFGIQQENYRRWGTEEPWIILPLVSWETRNGKERRNYYHAFYRSYYKDPFLPKP